MVPPSKVNFQRVRILVDAILEISNTATNMATSISK
jgi:hypothetical protein